MARPVFLTIHDFYGRSVGLTENDFWELLLFFFRTNMCILCSFVQVNQHSNKAIVRLRSFNIHAFVASTTASRNLANPPSVGKQDHQTLLLYHHEVHMAMPTALHYLYWHPWTIRCEKSQNDTIDKTIRLQIIFCLQLQDKYRRGHGNKKLRVALQG
jgi:hypothetical protein